MTTFYSQRPQTQFFNIPMLEAELTKTELKLISDEFTFATPVVINLEEGTEVDDYFELFHQLRGYTLSMLYSVCPGYFQLYFTNRFDTRIVGISTPGYKLHATVDFHKVKEHDESRYRPNGVATYDYSDLFAKELTAWPTNRYLRTVVKHPWWSWATRKDADGEDDMVLVMSNPHPMDDDENYIRAEVTREMWERARANFLIIDAVSRNVPRADSPDGDQYESLQWLGHFGELDLWCCDSTTAVATWNGKHADDSMAVDLNGDINPGTSSWVHEVVRRLRAYHPQLDHLSFP